MKDEVKRMKMTAKQFPRSVKKWELRLRSGKETEKMCDIPNKMTGHFTNTCPGNVHNDKVIAAGSFGKTTVENDGNLKKVADLENDSSYSSGYHNSSEESTHARNNWRISEGKKLQSVQKGGNTKERW
jgi:hypothetical protein